jgi:hypothetical protein
MQAAIASEQKVGDRKLSPYFGDATKCSISGSEFKNGDVVCVKFDGGVVRVNGYRGPGELTGSFFSFQK